MPSYIFKFKNRRKRTNMALCLLALLMLATGCTRKEIQVIKEMVPLRNDLVKKYKAENINITIWNGNAISLSFVNSAFNDLPGSEKKIKAAEIARYVNSHYKSIESIQTISVGFIIYKNYILFDYTNGLNKYFFRTADL